MKEPFISRREAFYLLRTNKATYVLYSVGWNEIDDGGVAGTTPADGDWVWQ